MKGSLWIWIARAAFSLVFLINMQCAISFVIFPEDFVTSFQLSYTDGNIEESIASVQSVRALGIAFMMWNVTYPFFIYKPSRYRVIGIVILLQQLIGLLGETYILLCIPDTMATLSDSILRFIIFDLAGLMMMSTSFVLLVIKMRVSSKEDGSKHDGNKSL